jgi:hypothetical protein
MYQLVLVVQGVVVMAALLYLEQQIQDPVVQQIQEVVPVVVQHGMEIQQEMVHLVVQVLL